MLHIDLETYSSVDLKKSGLFRYVDSPDFEILLLGLTASQQKLSSETALIRYFSTPCKPTKVNGGRTRNLPADDPEKWELYKAYNAQDVVTEMEVAKRLEAFPVPEQIQREWELDQRINLRGVMVDLDLVQHAIACFGEVKDHLTEELKALTGLQNPHSVAQLKGWLEEQTGKSLEI